VNRFSPPWGFSSHSPSSVCTWGCRTPPLAITHHGFQGVPCLWQKNHNSFYSMEEKQTGSMPGSVSTEAPCPPWDI
jgi:hypothetical protein